MAAHPGRRLPAPQYLNPPGSPPSRRARLCNICMHNPSVSIPPTQAGKPGSNHCGHDDVTDPVKRTPARIRVAP
jgi:hypothetical protein